MEVSRHPYGGSGAPVMRPRRDYGRNPIESALLDEDIAL
jgi:hypothetical protein